MKILVINSGSSSLKFELIDMTNEKSIAKGLCERIGIANPMISYKNLIKDLKITEQPEPMDDHKMAIDAVLKLLQDDSMGVIKSVDEIDAIGHRVVQGGAYFKDSALVDEKVISLVEELGELAPLHNPAAAMGVRVMMELLPDKKNVVVFDTSFHQTMEPKAYMYAFPYEDYEELKVRKYGAHGTSHRYVSEIAAQMLGKKDSKIIVCHLGNGASITAVKNGKVVDTSMGLTPLAGVMMGTRTGDVDPSAVVYIMEKRGLTPKEMNTRMNKQSGIKGIFGPSSDFRDLAAGVEEGNEKAKLAYEMFCYKIKSYIGAYAAAMNGLDAIAFTGGIGENAFYARRDICRDLTYLGIDLDEEKSSKWLPGNVEITKENSKVKVYKIETAEEIMIARDTYRLTRES